MQSLYLLPYAILVISSDSLFTIGSTQALIALSCFDSPLCSSPLSCKLDPNDALSGRPHPFTALHAPSPALGSGALFSVRLPFLGKL